MTTYSATHFLDLAALCFLAGLIHSTTTLNRSRKKPFLVGIMLTVLVILAEAGTVLLGTFPNLRSLNIFCNLLGFALTPLIPLAITLILDRGILPRRKLIFVPTALNLLAVVFSPRFNWIFHVSSHNGYARGRYFALFIVVYLANLLFLAAGTLEIGKRHNYPLRGKLLVLALFTIGGTSIQLIFPSVHSSWHCVTLALFFYFFLLSEFDSSFDALTGLYNRSSFDRAVRNLGDAGGFCLIMIDIDDFKLINDAQGHDVGDQVMRSVAEVVRRAFGREYTCYRFGGDEFAVIGSETEPGRVEDRLRAVVSGLEDLRRQDAQLPTVSYGYSVVGWGEQLDFHRVFKEADDQMYRSKREQKANGRGQER